MTKNFIELIKSKDYSAFADAITESLDNRAIDTFEKFSEATTQRLKESDEFDAEDVFSDEELEAILAEEEVSEDVSLEDVIAVLLDEGALTEEDLETVTEEELLELSRKTLDSYEDKASNDLGRGAKHDAKREKGAALAQGKKIGTAKVGPTREEFEEILGVALDEGLITESDLETITLDQIEEISKKTLGSYIKKAQHHVAAAGMQIQATVGDAQKGGKTEAAYKKAWHGYNKRSGGINKAVDRLTKEAVEVSEGHVEPAPAESIVAKYRKVIGADATAKAVIAGDVAAAPNKTDQTATETHVRDSKYPGAVSGPVSKGSSIISKYKRTKGLDATASAVVNGNADGDKNRSDENDDETRVRNKKNPGKEDGKAINPFKEEVEAETVTQK